jgi:hypothetical protein
MNADKTGWVVSDLHSGAQFQAPKVHTVGLSCETVVEGASGYLDVHDALLKVEDGVIVLV